MQAVSKDKWIDMFTQWYCTQRGTKLDKNMSDRESERQCILLCLYTVQWTLSVLMSVLQAQNDNRIQLTSNGFTAHINLSLCGVTNDLTPSVRMEFLIAHCSMCCEAHIVNGTLLKSVRNLSLQNKLATHPSVHQAKRHNVSFTTPFHSIIKEKKKLTSSNCVRLHTT